MPKGTGICHALDGEEEEEEEGRRKFVGKCLRKMPKNSAIMY